ncbi:MAG TPA: hypothetical protein VN429_04825 [Methanospirillum sp.]|uniref:hypothetical protein n=1 Tax=Methanospirillum sp. TaxID=45200 RepID=UPI002CE765DC|nr:hypothetical protein [Methanospirillum sp.]HWQ63718.1 hypothetical protein [Methanospirillum sp.]
MSCIAFYCDYDCSLLTGTTHPKHKTIPVQTDLSDLVGSNEMFLSHLEAIHYLDFPGW